MSGDGEAAVSTDGNKSVDVVIAEPLKHLIGTVNLRFASVGMLDHATERIAAIGGLKNGAAEVRDLADGRTMKFHQSTVGETFRLEESVVALANADDLPAQFACSVHGAMNHGIQAGSVAAAGIDRDLFQRRGQAVPLSVRLADYQRCGTT